MSKAYPSNLTLKQFELLNDLIPDPKPGGRQYVSVKPIPLWILSG